jgi:hypothetical protein
MASVPPNNPLKLPFFFLGAVVCAIMIVVGAFVARWDLVIVGAIGFGVACVAIPVARRGDNPWWMRSPLDYLRRRR